MLRRIAFLFLLFLFPCIISCDESADEKPIDKTAPEIVLVTPKAGARVKGQLDISAKVEDSSDDVFLALYFDDDLVKEAKTKEINIELDTKLVSEGPHTIKLIATDQDGNQNAKQVNIEVRNTLFHVVVPEGYVSKGSVEYFLLSRNDGERIALVHVENGKTISVPTPDDFNPDSTFVFTRLNHFESEGHFSYNINTVEVAPMIYAGTYTLFGAFKDGPVTIGTHTVNISGAPATHQLWLTGNYLEFKSGNFGSEPNFSIEVSMYRASSNLFVSLAEILEGVPTFAYLPSIESGGTSSLSSNEFVEMDMKTISLPGDGAYQLNVEGFSGDDPAIPVFFRLGNTINSQVEAYYPGSIFDNYTTRLDVTINNVRHVVSKVGSVPPSSFEILEAEISDVIRSGNGIELSTVGNFDKGRLGGSWEEVTHEGIRADYFGIVFPQGFEKVVLPEMPAEFAIYGMVAASDLEFKEVEFTDFSDIDGSEEYLSAVLFRRLDEPRIYSNMSTKSYELP